VQEKSQRQEAIRFQLHEAVVADQVRELAPQMLTDIRRVKGLEIAKAQLLKRMTIVVTSLRLKRLARCLRVTCEVSKCACQRGRNAAQNSSHS
jgi:hypothetical protein